MGDKKQKRLHRRASRRSEATRISPGILLLAVALSGGGAWWWFVGSRSVPMLVSSSTPEAMATVENTVTSTLR